MTRLGASGCSQRWPLLSVLLVFVLLGACTRPTGLQVREGGDPDHADDDVAFRTTYYFRVFDPCTILERQNAGDRLVPRPLNDTIYRFLMTGKASTLLSDIRFESGTLKASEIDPFGASVEYNRDLNRFVFESQEDLKARAQRKIALSSFEELKALYDQLAGKPQAPDPDLKPVRDQLSAALAQLVTDYTRRPAADPASGAVQKAPLVDPNSVKTRRDDDRTRLTFSVIDLPQQRDDYELVIQEREGAEPQVTLSRVGGAQAKAALEKPAVVDCLNGDIATRRGFQILGPEGWRTFDQDERLLLAMSADSQPLIGTLKELSQRVLRSHEAGFAYRLPLARERLRVAQANDQLDLGRDDETPQVVLDRAIRAFGVSVETPAADDSSRRVETEVLAPPPDAGDE